MARAHRDGVLTCASLMVGAPAAHDAVKIARELPDLRVGLHPVLADGYASAPAADIPALIAADGRFDDRMVRDGVRFFFLPEVRRQLAREIRAQFETFAATGLTLDHVNTHKHFHLHPTVLSLILKTGREFGMRAMRLPREMRGSLLLAPWVARVAKRLDRAGIACNDYAFGMTNSGAMDTDAMIRVLERLPPGITEIYCHPATPADAPITPSMRDYRHADELDALLSPRLAAAIASANLNCGGFQDVCLPGAPPR
ncbi:cellobiose phosphotransferase system celC [Candidatus Paraburkholderia kirkii UZHbot1]|uniref:Cellobiose phosphotransferase system celC n=1 Tax=Candidatus Paraburkholderia kirkii UZHbot1 TaxID=1055526 RepID=G4M3Z8_9BURK|nr:cellobiose phosphotransferase system celC [Candidatus Paraburkholderia kirkii UZHbot1]